MIKPGLCSMSFPDLSPAEVVKQCQMNSVGLIEWSGRPYHLPPESTEAKVKEIAKMCSDAGISTPSYGSYFCVLNHSPEQFPRVLDIAQGLGAGTVRVWSSEYGNPGEMSEIDEDQKKRLIENTRAIAELAAARRIRVAFEYHLHTPTCGAEEVLYVLDKAGHENCYTYFQMIIETRRSVDDNVADLERVYPRLAYVHCHYYEGEELFPLSRGAHMWKPLYAKLVELGYSGPLYLEYYRDYTPEKMKTDLEFPARPGEMKVNNAFRSW